MASGTSTYLYDGEGRRVRKIAGGVTSWFWYGADGSLVAEDTTETQEAGRQYLHVDALGSTRLVTRADQSVAARMDYWPFGEEVQGSALYGNRDLVSGYTSASTVKQRFTGKERDQENGFDYFGARYYAGVMGRWTSPDEWQGGVVDAHTGLSAEQPGPLPFSDITQPQTLNRYGYVLNNPMRYTDPDGHCVDVMTCGLEGAAIGAPLGPLGSASGAIIGGVIGAGISYGLYKAYVYYQENNDNKDGAPPPPPGPNAKDAKKTEGATPAAPPPSPSDQGKQKKKADEKKNDTRATKPEKNTLEGAQINATVSPRPRLNSAVKVKAKRFKAYLRACNARLIF